MAKIMTGSRAKNLDCGPHCHWFNQITPVEASCQAKCPPLYVRGKDLKPNERCYFRGGPPDPSRSRQVAP